MPTSYFLTFDDLEVEVRIKNIKHIYLRLDKITAQPFVDAPKRADQQTIKHFVQSKINWIKKHQTEIRKREILPPKVFENGENHHVFGNLYYLKIQESSKPNILVENQELILQIKPNSSKEKRKLLLEKFYRSILEKEISLLIQKWEPMMKVKVYEFGIKKMKTKWGTCNILAKRIWLNLELAKRPYACLEYVVVHEMVHLLERNHTPKFHAYMTQFLPNWKEIKVILNERRID